MPDLWLGLLVVGLIAGVASGMFGIGGGVIIVPALTVFLGFETVEAISTSLAALLLPVGIFAVIAYHQAALLELRASAFIAFGLLATSWFGAEITLSLPVDTLRRIYGAFLLYISWRFVEPRKLYAAWQARRVLQVDEPSPLEQATEATPSDEKITAPDVPWYVILLVGLIAGVASGMFGIGGGAVIVPALVAILRYDQKLAVGTSLGALLLPVGLPGVLNYAADDVLDLAAAALVAIGLLVGAIFGARIALNLPSKTVKRLYGVFLLFVALRFILQ
ncbi:MAG: sulfite exporter TauE/SafE family protein [Chloroflexi bacterium]|nr:sulfite exporter TauE/SafE family protein [Chloroflexota bacterium]